MQSKKTHIKTLGNHNISTLFVLCFQIFIAFISSFLSAILFYKITDKIIDNETAIIDNFIVNLFVDFRSVYLTKVMLFFSDVGMDGVIVFSILIPLIFLLKKRYRDASLFSIMIFIGVVINYSLKSLIQRERPVGFAMINEPTFSFPSGHSMNSFIFFVTLAYFVFKYSNNKLISLITFVVSGLCIFMVGLSRIYLGVHYPSDILGGYIAGFLWIASFYLIDKTLTMIKLVSKD